MVTVPIRCPPKPGAVAVCWRSERGAAFGNRTPSYVAITSGGLHGAARLGLPIESGDRS